ncbi:MAG: phosphoenolpyruvate--protein phosphotransferase [Lautropia sp.]|nr:phosphoenolpyruvate--protein phosphotransferase [Lautropia sp.]
MKSITNSPEITPVEVQLAAAPADRDSAVRAAGELLIKAGFAQDTFTDSLLKRENTATTFLGQGVAIPHGMIEDKHLVRQTGLAVLQVPGGVVWGKDAEGNDQVVKLVVAIAAASDEHIKVLRRLTRLMRDEARLEKLKTTSNAAEIVEALTGEAAAGAGAATAGPALADFPVGKEITLGYPNGLHARPAGQWVESIRRFKSQVHVRCGDIVADARSVASLLSLGAGNNARLRVSADGPDAQDAISALLGTIKLLGDEETRQARQAAAKQAQAQGLGRELGNWQPEARHTFTGIAAAPGLVTGTLVLAEAQKLEASDDFRGVAQEAATLDTALANAQKQLATLISNAERQGQNEQANIFKAHLELLRDPSWLRDVTRTVIQGHGAAWAWQHNLNTRIESQRSLQDATLAARAADLQDVGERVLRHLLGRGDEGSPAHSLPSDAILLADDLAPSFTAQIDTSKVKGFCTARGGPTAHTAILARALGMPAVVAAGAGVLSPALAQGGEVKAILDGYRGSLYVAPTDAALAEAATHIANLQRLQAEEAKTRLQPATTTDGHRVEIGANANRADQARRALEAGAEGVGLMRTEFLFLERDHVPDEDEQYEVYRAMVDVLGGKPLIVRTLDIGGDKQVPHLDLPIEENPFLGVRGARLQLRREELLVPQLRALYRAAKHGPLSIMFPMISSIEEVQQLRERLEAIRTELDAPAVPIGIMIEVPSAAVMADKFAQYVDFFSIGTNDLTQYALAIDRQHPELASLADALHPAVLRLIAQTVAGARPFKRHVGVCGGLAGDPLGAALLVGLGVDELSMSSSDIGSIKALLRRQSLTDLQAVAHKALEAENADQVRALGASLKHASSQPAGDAA